MSTEGPKTLVFDIERVPGRFRRKYRGLTVEGDFWDLSQYKTMIGRIHADDVLEWPRTVCIAWRFIGKRKVEFAAEWLTGHDEMLDQIWSAIDEADIVVGHNVKDFDLKHLRTEWRDAGFEPPSKPAIVDTLKAARAEFGDESKTLDALTKRLGISSKTDHYDVATARAAVAGDKRAQRKIRSYNVGDIEASEALYLELRPWIRHPNVGLFFDDGVDRCDCGSVHFVKHGFAVTSVSKFQRYRCAECGKTYRGKRSIATIDRRAVA